MFFNNRASKAFTIIAKDHQKNYYELAMHNSQKETSKRTTQVPVTSRTPHCLPQPAAAACSTIHEPTGTTEYRQWRSACRDESTSVRALFPRQCANIEFKHDTIFESKFFNEFSFVFSLVWFCFVLFISVFSCVRFTKILKIFFS